MGFEEKVMPLYRLDNGGQVSLIYAKTPRGAQNHALASMRAQMIVSTITPLEAAVLASQGVPVQTVGVGPDVVMDNDPPQATRSYEPDVPMVQADGFAYAAPEEPAPADAPLFIEAKP